MLRACVIDFKGSWDDHLSLIEFAYFKALYGMRYRSHIGWFKVGEVDMFYMNLVYQAMEKVKVI